MKATAPFAITAGNVGGGGVSSRAVEGGSVPGAVPPPPSAQPEMAAMLAEQKGSKSSTGSRTSSNITNTAPTPPATAPTPTAPTPTATATASINGSSSSSSSNCKGDGVGSVGSVGCIPTGGSPRSNNLQVDSSSANADPAVGGVPIVLLSRDLSVRGGDSSSHGIVNGIADMRSIVGGGGSSSGGGGGAPKGANVIVASQTTGPIEHIGGIARARGKRECPSCKAVVGKYRRTSYHLYESYGRTVQCTHVQCGATRQRCSFAVIGACRPQNVCLQLILSSGLVYFCVLIGLVYFANSMTSS